MNSDEELRAALTRLDQITRTLRRECPWDREQDERTIVPHTVEEAYELADAANNRDDIKLLDELGDVLFQVYFLSLLLEERGAGDLAAVAEHCVQKLIRRHPHVFGSTQVETSREVLANWDRIKQEEPGRERGIFVDIPENLPSLLYARKVQRRAAARGVGGEAASRVGGEAASRVGGEAASREGGEAASREGGGETAPGEGSVQAVHDELDELAAAADDARRFHELGDVLFAVVDVARQLRIDPELALRAASDRFRDRVMTADQR